MNHKFTNKLINEKSPYLLQHAHNPVDWHPWGDEAFDKAKNEDKPIFLSIGYSTCHWCHVMERESFEDIEVAKLLNDSFISIKVDREERTDVDHIYMNICQALTGQGGWPLTIIMTPDRKPFFAGTYFPKKNLYGRSGIMDILNITIKKWRDDREHLIDSSNYITDTINQSNARNTNEDIRKDILKVAFKDFLSSFDDKFGGFGTNPKFPMPHNLYFLIRYYHNTNDSQALLMVEKTLENMYRGGIYDHIGFGFSRYSTDKKWLVPHFEKMLYDNALLSIAYLEGYQVTNNKLFAKVSRDIFSYVIREMTYENGGFYSAQDADSEGVEGKFYVWDKDEIISILGKEDGGKFCEQFDVRSGGNFEGKSIPNLIESHDKYIDENIIKKLYDSRDKRIHPYKDDKILTSWNGLMIAAFSIGARVLKDSNLVGVAQRAIDFIYDKLFDNNGRLLTRYRDGQASHPAYAQDYAFLIWGLIEFYLSTFNVEYLEKAIKLNDNLIKYFWDDKDGGLFIYGSDGEKLIARPKEIYDGALPSANSVATLNWLKLSRLTGNTKLEEFAQKQFKCFGKMINENPSAYTYMLCSYIFSISKSKEIVIVGDMNLDTTQNMINTMYMDFHPYTTALVKPIEKNTILEDLAPFTSDYKQIDERTTAYVCQNFNCHPPVVNITEFENLIMEQ